jgi:FtsH-binding integral membrane protein
MKAKEYYKSRYGTAWALFGVCAVLIVVLAYEVPWVVIGFIGALACVFIFLIFYDTWMVEKIEKMEENWDYDFYIEEAEEENEQKFKKEKSI